METRQRVIEVFAAATIGFAAGHFGAESSAKVHKGQEELANRFNPASRGGMGLWKGSATISKPDTRGETRFGTNADWQPTGMFERFKITQEDWEKTIELNKLREKGEYVLQNERPTTRKVLDQDFTEITAQEKEKQAAAYDRVFAELGMKPEIAEQIKSHAAKIHRASLETEVAMQQLLQARHDYDTRLRDLLDEEGYNRYRQFEESKPAARELDDFRNFVENQSLVLDSQHEPQLKDLMQQAQAYTSVTWHEPFDGLPEPRLDAESVLAEVQREKAQITERANQLLAQAAQAGLPEEYQDLLANYYTQKINQRQAVIDELSKGFANGSPSQNPGNPTRGGK